MNNNQKQQENNGFGREFHTKEIDEQKLSQMENRENMNINEKQQENNGFGREFKQKLVIIESAHNRGIGEKNHILGCDCLDKEIRVDLESISPSLNKAGFSYEDINNGNRYNTEDIEGLEEKTFEIMKNFENMSRTITKSNVLDDETKKNKENKEKFIELIELGKNNLVENIELKREIIRIREEIMDIAKENKRLRYNNQKNISELEENKEKGEILQRNYNTLEKKVHIYGNTLNFLVLYIKVYGINGKSIYIRE